MSMDHYRQVGSAAVCQMGSGAHVHADQHALVVAPSRAQSLTFGAAGACKRSLSAA
jgi:hypothetical protein